jgi:hypothetical protein
MTPIAKTHDDDRWPISVDTDSGRVFLTTEEAEALYHSLSIALIELDLRDDHKQGESNG